MNIVSPKEIILNKSKKYDKIKVKLIKWINYLLNINYRGEEIGFSQYQIFYEEKYGTLPIQIQNQILDIFRVNWEIEIDNNSRDCKFSFNKKNEYSDTECKNDLLGINRMYSLEPKRTLTSTIFIWIIRIICFISVVSTVTNFVKNKSILNVSIPSITISQR